MTRNGVVWVALTLIVTISIIVYSTYFNQLRKFPEEQEIGTVKLDCWIYTKGWEMLLNQFQEQHPDVDLNVRTFRSYKDLFEELQAALSAHSAPAIVELENSYGLTGLVGKGALKKVSVDYPAASRIPEIMNAFMNENGLWAVPAGISVPVLLYNQDLVKWAGLTGSLAFSDLGDLGLTVRSFANDLSERNVNVIWQQGLGIDEHNIPFLFMNFMKGGGRDSNRTQLIEMLDMWSGLVHGSGVMNPLQHRLAASDFISGKMLFYMTGSEQMKGFDRYIAGKFAYGLLPLPGTDDHGLLPRISAFALIAGERQSRYEEELIRFLTSADVQMNVLNATGYMPVRLDVLDELGRDMVLSDKYRTLLLWVKSIAGRPPSANDHERDVLLFEALRTVELDPGANKLEIAEKLLPYMP